MKWLFALLVLSLPAAAQTRWTLAIGNDRGLRDEEQLRFAESDARKALDTFLEVGGASRANSSLVLGGDAASLRVALQSFEARLNAEAKKDDRLTVFVSSHAGEAELHLAGTTLALSELTDFVKRAPVAVGILILDTCRSGAVTRLKGLKPLDVPAVVVDASALEGRVYLSASGSDEYAQESDAIGGSYFTHHLLTGLRGAADTSRDGDVTLDEAYAWAWSRTLESTFGSRGGAQRPAFKVDLRGAGALVLSTVKNSSSRLVLLVEAPGQWLVVAAESGAVVADLDKPRGPLTLALPPGSYRVQWRVGGGFSERAVQLPSSGAAVLRSSDFDGQPLIKVARRGEGGAAWTLSASAAVASPLIFSLGAGLGGAAKLRREAQVLGPINTLGLSLSLRNAQLSADAKFSQLELEARAGVGFHFERGRFLGAVSLEAGAIAVFQNNLPNSESRFGLEPVLGAGLEGRFRIGGALSVVLEGHGGVGLVKKTALVAVVPRGVATLGLALDL